MKKDLKICTFKGEQLRPYIGELAKLRIQVFRDYPYLYEGDLEYEENYLSTYINCPAAMMVLVFDDGKVVGASTAIPLQYDHLEMQQPFIEHNIDINTVFYLGESILLPEYRGQGLYRQFFAEREKAALESQCKIAAFIAIKRSPTDLRRPKDYQDLDNVWQHFGYIKHPELCVYYEYKEVGETSMSPKPLIYWLKDL